MRKWLFFMLAGYLWKKFGAKSEGPAGPGAAPVRRR